MKHIAILTGLAAWAALSGGAQCQESSLFHNPIYSQRPAATMMQPQGAGQGLANNQLAGANPPSLVNPLRSDSPITAQGSSMLAPSVQAPMPQSSPSGQMMGPVGQVSYYGGSPLSIQSPAVYNYQPPPRQRVLRTHDIVQIRVDEISRMTADGIASQRKNGIYDATLQDWIRLEGLDSLTPAVMENGEPRVRGQTNQVYRANSQIVTRESLTFNIAAEIVDIYPNGNIVLEAHKEITNNDNRWKVSLTGICQDAAIGADNVVLSKDILNLKIDKHEAGQARDGYRRGWFSEWLGRFQPF